MFFSFYAFSAFAKLGKDSTIHSKWSISAAINSVEAQIDQKLFDTWVFPSANYYAYFGDKQDKSYSFSIIPKYQFADDILLRFELGITGIDLRSHYNGINDTGNSGFYPGAVANIIKDVTIEQNIYRILPGLEWNFIRKKHIEFYCGASINFLYYDEMRWTDYIVNNTSINTYAIYNATTPGGFASGIGGFMGFRFNLNRNWALGTEFSYALLYYKLGGVQEGTYEKHIYNGMFEIIPWTIDNNASTGIQFSKLIPSFNITMQL